MDARTRMYLHEDMYINPGRIEHYMPNMGRERTFGPESQHGHVGIFGHLRPLGRAPRGVNLWETNGQRLVTSLSEQFGQVAPEHFETWWRRSAGDRSGGWDRFMLPGPGSLPVAEVAAGPLRPCVVQQEVQLRLGTVDDYLAWHVSDVIPAARSAGWEPLVHLKAMHSPFVVTMLMAESWERLVDLAEALPEPDPSWGAEVTTSALKSWWGSSYLQR